MKYLVFLVLVVISVPNNGFAELDSHDNSQDNRVLSSSKIYPTLLKWQSSENHDEFAKTNDLLYKEGKVQVYIHLTSEKFLSQIPSEINIIASDQNIAVAYVTPEQLDEFENLDFVDRVTLPDLARISVMPQITVKDEIDPPTQKNTILTILIISIISIAVLLSVVLHRK